MGLALYYAELWSPARYYKEAIRLNSISEIRERIAIWTAWYTFIKERNFTSFQSVYGCLSVYRHNVSPRFHNHCLLQLSLPTFKLPFRVHFTWHNSIWRHWSLLWQRKNTAFCVRDSFRSITQEPNNQSIWFFHCLTIARWYTDFWSISILKKCGMCQVFTQRVTYACNFC